MKRIIPFLLQATMLAAPLFAEEPRAPERYCNPLPIPNYPIGKLAREITKGEPNDGGLWLSEKKEQYRELADPAALWHDGAWYLYPSCAMAGVSRDEGRSWQHHPLNVRDLGYAPAVVRHGKRFLLMGSGSERRAHRLAQRGDLHFRRASPPSWSRPVCLLRVGLRKTDAQSRAGRTRNPAARQLDQTRPSACQTIESRVE